MSLTYESSSEPLPASANRVRNLLAHQLTLVSLSLRLKDLLGPVTTVKKKREEASVTTALELIISTFETLDFQPYTLNDTTLKGGKNLSDGSEREDLSVKKEKAE